MKIKQSILLEDLINRTKELIQKVNNFQALPPEALNYKSDPQSWSILECLEHLNLYGDFYLKEIEHRIIQRDKKTTATFKSGILGNYFANSMLPKNGKIIKMKTFKDKDPSNSSLSTTTIDRFLKQQQRMIELLMQAKNVDLNKVKTSITIPVFKLKLGDTFRFVIYHNQRHLIQAKNMHDQIPDGMDINRS